MIYIMRNPFHNSEARLRIKGIDGEIISGARMRRAARQLCPYADCTCLSSPASRGDSGVKGHPEIYLEPAYLRNDYDAYVVRVIFEEEVEPIERLPRQGIGAGGGR